MESKVSYIEPTKAMIEAALIAGYKWKKHIVGEKVVYWKAVKIPNQCCKSQIPTTK